MKNALKQLLYSTSPMNFILDYPRYQSDFEYIVKWLKVDYDQRNDNSSLYCNREIIKHCFANNEALIYRCNGNAEGFVCFSIYNKVVTLPLISINPKFRRQGIGKRFVADYIEYFKKKDFLVAEAQDVTSEGEHLCKSTSFSFKEKFYSEINYYRILVDHREQNWNAMHRLALWKSEIAEGEPDYSWNIEFNNDKRPIICITHPDWKVAIIESNLIIKKDKVKYFANRIFANNITPGYIYVDQDISNQILKQRAPKTLPI